MDSVSGANASKQKATQEEDASLEESSLNPPELEIHKFIQCDGCSMYPIIGVRYVCSECDDFDLCSNCEKDGVHQQHILVLSTTVKSQEEDTSSEESSVNPPELEIHTCEGCSMNPIIGDRYMCCECDDLSLCTSCKGPSINDVTQIFGFLDPPPPPCHAFLADHKSKSTQPPLLHHVLDNPPPPSRA